jgi:hypothetical protein
VSDISRKLACFELALLDDFQFHTDGLAGALPLPFRNYGKAANTA